MPEFVSNEVFSIVFLVARTDSLCSTENFCYRYVLPVGLRLDVLRPNNAGRVAVDTKYGKLSVNRTYFQYILEAGFPNVCIYNEKNIPIAYALLKPQGCMGAASVSPEYRCMGLFMIVTFELLKKLKELGEKLTFVEIKRLRAGYSKKADNLFGGKVYEGYEASWIEFLPHHE